MAHRGTPISPILTDSGSEFEVNKNGQGGGVTGQLPSLKQVAESTRPDITSFNEYKDIDNQRYSATHPNAISDGDEHGRGDSGSGVGTLTDTKKKTELLYTSGNKYKPGNNSGYYVYNYPEQYW
jgi:hypothetical protein